MQDLVNLLTAQQIRIFKLLEFDERPVLRPPADEELLSKLENWLIGNGGSLPESYREFLQVCDGIENFCVSYSLLGARDLLGDSYPSLLANALDGGIGYAYSADLRPILIGYDNETTTRVFFDFYHEPLRNKEPVVFEGDPGDMSIHESFGRFLEFRAQTNELTIAHLHDLRTGRTQE